MHRKFSLAHPMFWTMLLLILLLAGCSGDGGTTGRNPVAPEHNVVDAQKVEQAEITSPTLQTTAGNSLGSTTVRNVPPLPGAAPETTQPVQIPDRLVISKIDLDIPVVELGWSSSSRGGEIFSEWDVAEYAAGWHKNSRLPGEQGNIVMSGHNNILGAVFRELDQLRKDDEIRVYTGSSYHTYTVERVMIVPERYAKEEQQLQNAKWIDEFSDERLTLVSCWPRNNNTHRVIVVAKPLPTE
jgi:LPXTG-site transpeptidase (sortase) family protein